MKRILVTKRDGSKESFDPEKLHKILFWATEGITGVSVSQIETKSHIQLYPGILTDEIHEIMIATASELISEETPNYQWVASRLRLFQLRKEALGEFKPWPLKKLVHRNVELRMYTAELLEWYTDEDWDSLDKIIDHNRDFTHAFAGMEQFHGKYLVQNRLTGQVFETPQYLNILVAATMFHNYPIEIRMDYVKDFYTNISTGVISMPTPIMAGMRTNVRQFSSCFPAGSSVLTQDGYKNIENISIGEKVLTHNGNYKDVVATRVKKYQLDNFVSIDSQYAIEGNFTSTQDHKIYALKRSGGTDSITPSWMEAQDLSAGDLLHIPVNKEIEYTKGDVIVISDFINLDSQYVVCDDGFIRKQNRDKRTPGYNKYVFSINNRMILTEDLYRLFGYYIAEGSSNDHSVGFCFHENETQCIDDVKNIVKNEFDINCKVYTSDIDNLCFVIFHSRVLAKIFFKLLGKHSKEKVLSSEIMKSSNDLQYQLLLGVAQGAGCVTNQTCIIGLPSKNLITQISHIFLRNRIIPSLGKTDETVRFFENRQKEHAIATSYNLSVNTGSNGEFLVDVNKIDENQIDIKNGKFINDEYYSRIYSIEYYDADSENVYDLQVRDDHSFVVEGISVHNCVLIETADSLDSITATSNAIVKYVSQKAGIGIEAGRIRAINSMVRDGDTRHTGVTPFYRLFQSSVKSCSQGSVRNGAATLYAPFWHLEIETIMSLRSTKVSDDAAVRQMDYGIQFCNLAYKRLLEGGDITLFNPVDVPDLHDAFFADQELFVELYSKYEKKIKIDKKTITALDFFTKFETERQETGRLYKLNVDHANTHSSFIPAKAPIRMSNLCLEITLPVKPLISPNYVSSEYTWIEVRTEDINEFIKQKKMYTAGLLPKEYDCEISKLYEIVDRDDVINSSTEYSYFYEKILEPDAPEIALCTLGAINIGAMRTKEDLEKPAELIVRSLNELLDYQCYPVEAGEIATKKYRSLGIGVTNVAYWLAKHGYKYSDNSGLVEWNEWIEAFQFYLLKASMKLAKERGQCCPGFTDTKYSLGILPIDTYKKDVDDIVPNDLKMDWEQLRKDIVKYGLYNSTLTAQFPAETSSQINNATNGIEPPRSYISVKGSGDGRLKQVVPGFPRLKNKYELLWDQPDCKGYLNLCAVMQKYLDQSISSNTFYNPVNYDNEEVPMSLLLMDSIYAYKIGLKTLYYALTYDGQTDDLVDDCNGGGCTV